MAGRKNQTPLTQVIKGSQLSDKQLREKTRSYAETAIKRLSELCNDANPAVSLGAIKVLLAKCIPDTKAVEITGKDGDEFAVILRWPDGTRPAGSSQLPK